MLDPDHDCSWTRRRESELSRRRGALRGAGISVAVLKDVAMRVGCTLGVTSSLPGDYDEALTLGQWRGHLHDRCFVSFDADDATLRKALLEANLELPFGAVTTVNATRVR